MKREWVPHNHKRTMNWLYSRQRETRSFQYPTELGQVYKSLIVDTFHISCTIISPWTCAVALSNNFAVLSMKFNLLSWIVRCFGKGQVHSHTKFHLHHKPNALSLQEPRICSFTFWSLIVSCWKGGAICGVASWLAFSIVDSGNDPFTRCCRMIVLIIGPICRMCSIYVPNYPIERMQSWK